jgi:tetratricopeptide (TPR) repeat protein
MTDEMDWKSQQLDMAREMIGEGQQALQQGDPESADTAAQEALALVDMAEAEGGGPRTRRLRIRALNDRGLFAQQRDDMAAARSLHGRASELLEQVDEIDDEEFETTAAAVHLNLGQVALMDNDYAEARDATERALELVEHLRERSAEGSGSLALGVYQNKTAVESFTENFDAAVEAADDALELAETLADRGNPAALGQVARICQQLSVRLFEDGQDGRALEWGRRAESLAERTYNHVGEQALHLYVVSQINLISYYEQLRKFADAEDCLWKAIEVAGPDPEIVERGEAFYEHCRKQADKRLEEGNLPRDEVEMGYEDLQDVMEDAGLA